MKTCDSGQDDGSVLKQNMGFDSSENLCYGMPDEKKRPFLVTESAVNQIRKLLYQKQENGEKPAIGIRIIVNQKGCFGLKYNIEYAYEVKPLDTEMVVDNVLLIIDPKAMMYILGSTMDYCETQISSGFVFSNPNEKGRCGCGESFTVTEKIKNI